MDITKRIDSYVQLVEPKAPIDKLNTFRFKGRDLNEALLVLDRDVYKSAEELSVGLRKAADRAVMLWNKISKKVLDSIVKEMGDVKGQQPKVSFGVWTFKETGNDGLDLLVAIDVSHMMSDKAWRIDPLVKEISNLVGSAWNVVKNGSSEIVLEAPLTY